MVITTNSRFQLHYCSRDSVNLEHIDIMSMILRDESNSLKTNDTDGYLTYHTESIHDITYYIDIIRISIVIF